LGISLAAVSTRAASLPEDVFPELKGLLQDATTQSPRMLEQNLRRLAAEQQVWVSSSGLRPDVGFNLEYNFQYENRNSSSVWSFNNRYRTALTASYPLIHWGAERATADIGRLQAELAANGVVQAYRLLAVDLRKAYLKAVLDRAAMARARFSDDLMRRRFTILEQKVASGQEPSARLGSARLDLDESQLALERTTRAAEFSLRALRRLSGRANLEGGSLPEAIPAIPLIAAEETDQDVATYGDQRRFLTDYRYVDAEGSLANEKRQLNIVEVNQRPKFDLITGASLDQLSYVNNLGQRTGVAALYVGVRVNWNIFDGYATRGRRLTTLTRIRQLENNLTELEQDLRFAVEQSGTDLNLAGRAMALAEGRYNAWLGSFNLTAEKVQSNRASQDELDGAQLSLNDVELRLFMARADYLNAVALWLYNVNADPAVPSSLPSPSP